MAVKRDITSIIQDIQKSLNDATRKRILRPMAREAIRLIQKRTRSGRGVSEDGGNPFFLERLKPRTIARRKRLANLLSPFTTPGKSNLTFSGEMLFSIGIVRSPPGTITIAPRGRRNLFLASVHTEGVPENNLPARPFMFLSKGEIKKLTKFYRQQFLAVLRKRKLT